MTVLEAERRTVATRAAELRELTPGRTGNLSVRRGQRLAITPSGVPYDEISPDDVSVVSLGGEQVFGELAPSSESPMHRRIYERFEPGAIVHTHSPWSTTLAVLGEPLPPVHYMIVLAGETVPIAPYATYGTEELADNAVGAMASAESSACLLENHGLVATGEDAAAAIETAVAVESVARAYCQAQSVGTPQQLSEDALEATARKLEEYGPDEGEK
ncbi:L-fuculose-phosphate aldolase [Halalkaliarchaeum desulfuricum]|uniref:L-fuculose-phosphate aldolase n=1 Tax=Halalkaliarchaeum desulfuricum TaxID=2055893 RepID=A0A343TJ59_9EURY|nr:class II aldolase/adducin family protein [Halalkaliarchaeum desulfuricum]AUX09131.1 L-fuculose-phosphate aldolase [Halalkaliarchaeum desulfuricum]